ncbi:hypothetical protein RJ639_000499 [Escallonia herrerae]|uniref:FAR1 domain-containing protein n=1 Tax=Escallonia herrerae TaxID=1293975 RepID=A0AA89BIP5_9ASTE|nr:hypothetical protein RJ639_000499 [Escallonia herrerae]
MDAHSLPHFQSIEDVDANAYLVCMKSPNSFDSHRVEATQKEDCDACDFFDQDFGDCFIDERGNDSSDNESAHEQEDDSCNVDDDDHEDCCDNHFGGEVHGDFDYELTIGKVFVNEDEAYNFYNLYARLKGFGIRKHWATRSRTTGKLIKRQFVCNKEGFRSSKDNRQIGRETKRRRETRTGCGAMMGITLSNTGEWVVDKFLDSHNHDMNTPSKVIKHRSHRKFHRTMACKKLIFDFNKKGLRPCQIAKTVNALMTGHELEITRQQCSQVLNIERKNNVERFLSGDCRLQCTPRHVEPQADLGVGVALIDQLVLELNELELDLAPAVVLEDLSVGLLDEPACALAGLEPLAGPAIDHDIVALGPHEELVGLDVAVGARLAGGLQPDSVVHPAASLWVLYTAKEGVQIIRIRSGGERNPNPNLIGLAPRIEVELLVVVVEVVLKVTSVVVQSYR